MPHKRHCISLDKCNFFCILTWKEINYGLICKKVRILTNNLIFARKILFLLARFTKNCARKCARARSGFARNFWPLEKILLELARLENWKAKILLETRSARKLTCSFCSNSKNFRLVSALLHISLSFQEHVYSGVFLYIHTPLQSFFEDGTIQIWGKTSKSRDRIFSWFCFYNWNRVMDTNNVINM